MQLYLPAGDGAGSVDRRYVSEELRWLSGGNYRRRQIFVDVEDDGKTCWNDGEMLINLVFEDHGKYHRL